MNLLNQTKIYGILFAFFALFSMTTEAMVAPQIDETEIYTIKNKATGKYLNMFEIQYPEEVHRGAGFTELDFEKNNFPTQSLWRIVKKREEPFKGCYLIVNYFYENVFGMGNYQVHDDRAILDIGKLEDAHLSPRFFWLIDRLSDGNFEITNINFSKHYGIFDVKLNGEHGYSRTTIGPHIFNHSYVSLDEQKITNKDLLKWVIEPYRYMEIKEKAKSKASKKSSVPSS